MQTRSHATRNTEGGRELPPPNHPPQEEFLITPNALKSMLEEAASRAVAEAMTHFLAAQHHNLENNPNVNGELPPPQHQERRRTLEEEVGTNRVPNPSARRETVLHEEEVNSHGPVRPGIRTEERVESALAILPARRSPFTTAILAEVLTAGVKIASLPEYDGSGDPQDHLDRFYAKADLYDFSDAAYCKIFWTTLTNRALAWFNKLPAGSIASLEQLTQRFLHQFSINRKYPKTASYLFSVVQKEGESLREYVQRFTQAVHEVPHVNHDLLAGIMQQKLRHRKFKESIAGKPPSTLEELLERAEKYIRIEETIEPQYLGKRKREEEKPREGRKEEKRGFQGPRLQQVPLNARLTDILVVAEKQGLLQPPRPMKDNPKRLKSDKYCHFHKDKGHSTEDCYSLRTKIEKLIKRGYLKDFVSKSHHQQRDNKTYEDRRNREPPKNHEKQGNHNGDFHENMPTGGVIVVITGGPACGDSNRARKTLLRNASRGNHYPHPNQAQVVCEISKISKEMTFTESDREYPLVEHNDALVVSATISNFWVKKMLVDSGSSADIIFLNAFVKMGIDNAQLTPISTPLVGFSGEVVEALGEITLPLSLGSYPRRVTKMVKFLVVNASSAYNVILGRPSLNVFQAIGSTYHMKLKFPTSEGVGEAIGDSRLARECHANILRDPANCKKRSRVDEISTQKKRHPQTDEPKNDRIHTIDSEVEKVKHLEATEALKRIEVTSGSPGRTLKIGTEMPAEVEQMITTFLMENADVFAWEGKPLPGIPHEYALHQLNVDPRMKPVKQKKRSFGAEKNKHITVEVEKLVKTKYIRPVSYPEWLANVVLVPKPGGKWRLCIDFTDLNKACPKDLFPLPRIDLLVDSTAGCELLSFLDAYQGYNQIGLAPEDQEKASFITDQGIYCYEVMPFGLKNAGATYQRLVNKMFEKLIGRSMEVYIDDMLIKSVIALKHVEDIKECFEILRKYKMKLNPEKCAFGVRGGKFLGYMVSQRGIEANPEKIKAILSMAPPRA
ncbi:uncharacterized protein [Henckelia pumila]|uniref:uncharacterized protein n=1 Tax=Henckelia pumila TaxID=405737 RepID=UPI003C6E3F52